MGRLHDIETGIYAQQHRFACRGSAFANAAGCNVLGRFYERSTNKPIVKYGMNVVMACTFAASTVATDERLFNSKLCVQVGDGVMAT